MPAVRLTRRVKLLNFGADEVSNDRAFAVTDVYECPNEELESTFAAKISHPIMMSGALWDGELHPVDGTYQKSYFPTGKGRIIIQYRTLTIEEYLEYSASVMGQAKGVLLRRGSIDYVSVRTDDSGNVVSGLDPTDVTGRTRWEIVSGRPYKVEPHVLFRIRACVIADPTTEYSRLGFVNSTSMPSFGDPYGQIGHLLLVGVRDEHTKFNTSVRWAEFDFLGSKVKWADNGYTARKLSLALMQMRVYDTSGADTGTLREARVWQPTGETRAGPEFETADFGYLDSMLVRWGWQ